MNDAKTIGVGVAVFVYRDGKFLMGQRKGSHGHDTWSVPGGHLEFGETWEECAKREVLEETGMQIKNIEFMATTNDIFETGKHYVSIWVRADWETEEPQILEPDKFITQHWTTFQDLPQPLFEPCWINLHAMHPDLFTSKN